MGVVDKIAQAGVVGCGGAGFPTAAKLKGSFEFFIVNGAECEPLLRTDRYIMCHKAPELVEAITAIRTELGIPRAIIGLKAHYEKEVASLQNAIHAAGADIELCQMDSFYPAGDEQTLVYEATGRVVPPGGIPGMVGCVVDNIATVLAVYDAMQGKPLTQKYLTVTGEVNHPTVLHVPVGTSFRKCIELAGGSTLNRFFLVAGGPMMGRPVPFENLDKEFVTKTTSGILVLPEDGYHAFHYGMDLSIMMQRAKSACIQCSYCTQLCPRHLLGHPLKPHMIMRKMATGTPVEELLNDADIRNAALCCECGICEVYACPMGLQPRTINSMLRKKLGAAGIKYQRPDQVWTASEERPHIKAPTDRVIRRVGVQKYADIEIEECIEYQATDVTIPLRMHIGAPSLPVVTSGDRVKAGDLIADIPDGALGAKIHASIGGKVTVNENSIRIEA